MSAQWQYVIGYFDIASERWLANGDDVTAPYQIDFLRTMGERGWEVCGVDSSQMYFDAARNVQTKHPVFYLKRPAEDS